MLCVLYLHVVGGSYSLKSTPNDGFFEKLFTVALFTFRVLSDICLEEIAEVILFLNFVLMSDLGFKPWSNKPIPTC